MRTDVGEPISVEVYHAQHATKAPGRIRHILLFLQRLFSSCQSKPSVVSGRMARLSCSCKSHDQKLPGRKVPRLGGSVLPGRSASKPAPTRPSLLTSHIAPFPASFCFQRPTRQTRTGPWDLPSPQPTLLGPSGHATDVGGGDLLFLRRDGHMMAFLPGLFVAVRQLPPPSERRWAYRRNPL